LPMMPLIVLGYERNGPVWAGPPINNLPKEISISFVKSAGK